MRFVRCRAALAPALAALALASACADPFGPEYEYEEDLHLALDGAATVYVNASVPALVALRGADLPVDPAARLDRARVRALYEGEGAVVTGPSLSRRGGRRFVHLRIDVGRVGDLARLPGLAWSTYHLERRGDRLAYRQVVGAQAPPSADRGAWTGTERIVFRLHVPSEILVHNSPRPLRRGNILEWDQRLDERLQGRTGEMRVEMETESILYRTLILFASTIAAAAATFAGIVWWLSRRRGDARTASAD
jgi:hypothetical protein